MAAKKASFKWVFRPLVMTVAKLKHVILKHFIAEERKRNRKAMLTYFNYCHWQHKQTEEVNSVWSDSAAKSGPKPQQLVTWKHDDISRVSEIPSRSLLLTWTHCLWFVTDLYICKYANSLLLNFIVNICCFCLDRTWIAATLHYRYRRNTIISFLILHTVTASVERIAL